MEALAIVLGTLLLATIIGLAFLFNKISKLEVKLLVAEEVKDRALKSRDKMVEEGSALSSHNKAIKDELKNKQAELFDLQGQLGDEREKNKTLISQKKSSETRLGQISEHLVPFLKNCPYDPKSMHFVGNPIDYIVYDFDEGKIVFLEIKSGNSKPSKRQKLIKNMIQKGLVYYEEMRINSTGVKHKKAENDE